jgi:hypothetical protein
MKTKTIDLSGGALIFAGILIAGSMLFHPDDTLPGSFLRTAWMPVHILLGIAAIAALAGLGGLYSVMGPKLSTFGRVSFGLALLGTVLLAGVMLFFEATLLPALSRDPAYQPLLSGDGPIMNGLLGYLIWISMVIASVGYVLLAVYLIVSRTISYVNGFLFIGVPLAAFAPPIPYVLEVAGGVLFGIALLWLGVSIRSGTAHKALEETIRLQDECIAHAGSHA